MRCQLITTFKLLSVLLLFLPGSGIAQTGNTTLGSYGELHFNDVIYDENGDQTPGLLDFHRFVLQAGYDVNDRISIRTGLELKHGLLEAGIDEGGRLALEKAYADVRFRDEIGLRAGIIPVPVGFVNSSPEPTSFNGVERPNVESVIIPSEWREAGIGIFGNPREEWSYELYLMAGLDPEGITANGIGGARQNSFISSADNFAVTWRLEFRPNGDLLFGASYFFSDLSTNYVYGDAMKGTMLHLAEMHAMYQNSGFSARLLGSYGIILEVEQLNDTFGNGAGESQFGAYLELAYDMLRLSNTATDQQLNLFVRGEIFDTQLTVAGIPESSENERYEYTAGLTWKPAAEVVFKADYQLLQSGGIKNIHQLNLGVGFNF